MISKTPKFDKALDEYFAGLKLDEKGGQWRICRFSGEKFYIRPEDVEFYKRMRVPLPTLSPNERHRLKLAFFNSFNLFKVKSAYSGKTVIAAAPPNTPYKIWEHKIWFSDAWDPMEYGRAYDGGGSFFRQFHGLTLDIPRPDLYVDPASVNSDYTHNSLKLKNCYFVFESVESEDCLYGVYAYTKNSIDGFGLENSDTSYADFISFHLYNCFWCEHSRNCQNSYFLYDCRSCEYCFMCVNLRNKKYHFLNKPLGKEEYEAKIKEINLGNREVAEKYKKEFEELKKQAVHKPDHNEKAINSTGDYVTNSRNCFESSIVRDSENSAYCLGGFKIRDSYHMAGGTNIEASYESQAVNSYGVKFCLWAEESRDLEYCFDCSKCENCFGCVSLKNKKFCIFNEQYSEEEYWKLIDKIKAKMLADGEYGEFFPSYIAPITYNLSIAMSYVGYDNIETAKQYGYAIEEIPESKDEVADETVEVETLPADIKNVSDNILNKIIFDKKNNRKFRFIKTEVDFYRKYNIPLPAENPTTRIENMRKKAGTIKFDIHERICPKCGIEFETVYPLDDPRIVYCEPCYLKEVV